MGPLHVRIPEEDRAPAFAAGSSYVVDDRLVGCDVRNHSWLSLPYIERLLGAASVADGRVHFMDATEAPLWSRALAHRPISSESSYFLSYAESEDAERLIAKLGEALSKNGAGSVRPLDFGGEPPVAEVFTAALRWGGGPPKEADLRDVWASDVRNGSRESLPVTGVALADRLTDAQMLRVFELYQGSMAPLSLEHPELAEYSYEEYRAILLDPSAINFIATVDSEIVAHCSLLTDLQLLGDWLDYSWWELSYGSEMAAGELWYFPGFVTDNALKRMGHIGATLDLLGDLMTRACSRRLVTFVCNTESRNYTPVIVDKALDRLKTPVLGRCALKQRYQWFGAEVRGS
jgi:hypothetical protein